jgi:hypothetical protein
MKDLSSEHFMNTAILSLIIAAIVTGGVKKDDVAGDKTNIVSNNILFNKILLSNGFNSQREFSYVNVKDFNTVLYHQ